MHDARVSSGPTRPGEGARPIRPAARIALRAAALLACAATVPRLVAGWPVSGLWEDDLAAQDAAAREVAAYATSGVAASAFHTGSARFDGEWAFGTFTMAALGLGQVILAHPERRDAYVPALDASADALVAERTHAFGAEAWGTSPFAGLPGGRGHGYLGYSNLALSMIRLVRADTPHARLHDDLTEALARRLAAAPHALFDTYPGEAYPADMAMVAGSIALHDCATGHPERAWMPAWKDTFARWIDPGTGLLHQSGDAATGSPAGPPRASGTALAAFALSFMDRDLSRRLFDGLRRAQTGFLGFGGILEYGHEREGQGDIDSGPVVLGMSVSGTGFTLSTAKLFEDRELFTSLYRTADLFGVPVHRPGGKRFMSGGPLGNAILLAMTTATWRWQPRCKQRSGP